MSVYNEHARFLDRRYLVKLRVREVAEQQGHTMYSLQKATGMGMSTIRRYWYGTSDGKSYGPPIQVVTLSHIEHIADVLGTTAKSLLVEEEGEQTGNHMQLRHAA
jgi:transcriptional regulator with XRE-family HTH domain